MSSGDGSAGTSGTGHQAVRPYDQRWLHRAAVLRQLLDEALADVAVSIDHIGSTAVPGMPARPIIDIQVSVVDVSRREKFESALASVGYQYFPFPELPVDDYLVYVPKDGSNTEHVAVCQTGSWQERRHIAFRDYLRAHPAAAAQYAHVKRRSAEAAQGTRERYSAGKDTIVRDLQKQAVEWFDRHSRRCG